MSVEVANQESGAATWGGLAARNSQSISGSQVRVDDLTPPFVPQLENAADTRYFAASAKQRTEFIPKGTNGDDRKRILPLRKKMNREKDG
jgi:hypothetical protein